MFLSCLFEGNILDNNVRALSWENVGDLGVFDRQIITLNTQKIIHFKDIIVLLGLSLCFSLLFAGEGLEGVLYYPHGWIV